MRIFSNNFGRFIKRIQGEKKKRRRKDKIFNIPLEINPYSLNVSDGSSSVLLNGV